MITAVQQEAALAKVARILGADPAQVEFLQEVDITTLSALRDQISDVLQLSDAKKSTVTATAKLAPVPLAASIGEKWFGATMCARLVGLVDPKMARHYAKHLSMDFMADVTVQTDPRCVSGIVEELPLRTMQAIATNLLARGDHFTLSHFVAYVPPPVVIDILDAIADDAALVRIATYVEDLAVLDPIVALLPDSRLLALVTAVEREDLWPEGLHLFSALSSQQITRVATTLVETDEGVLSTALAAFDRHGLWSQGLRLIDHLGPEDMEQIAFALGQVDDEVIEAAVAAADANDLWEPVVRAALAAQGRAPLLGPRVAHLVERIPKAGIARFEETANALGHPDLLRILLAN
ncbi:MAG TPA: hypothetical protein VGG38_12315 [Acidimicrobiales bacterium]|jgi:hypothetical protein